MQSLAPYNADKLKPNGHQKTFNKKYHLPEKRIAIKLDQERLMTLQYTNLQAECWRPWAGITFHQHRHLIDRVSASIYYQPTSRRMR